MSMTRNLLGLALVAVAGTAVSADPVTFDATTTAFQAKVNGHFTASATEAKPSSNREGVMFAYNTFDCADCNWGWNIGWSEAGCYIDGGANDCVGYVWILTMGYADHGGAYPYEAPLYDDGAGNAWRTDIYYDDYQADAGMWGDTGALQPMVAFSGHCWLRNDHGDPAKTFLYDYLWISADGATFYGGWHWEILRDVDETGLFELTAGTADEPQDPADTFEIPYEGLICFDFANETPEGEDDGGAWNVFLGGDMEFVDLPYPTDLYVAGFNDETSWAAGGIDDPNIDPNWDGDPELSYLDILNTGFLINWSFTHADGALPGGHPTKMGVGGGGGCEGDLDGDGATGQTDLGILLAAFLNTPDGDLNGDGVTDQQDLGILLADYGCGL